MIDNSRETDLRTGLVQPESFEERVYVNTYGLKPELDAHDLEPYEHIDYWAKYTDKEKIKMKRLGKYQKPIIYSKEILKDYKIYFEEEPKDWNITKIEDIKYFRLNADYYKKKVLIK